MDSLSSNPMLVTIPTLQEICIQKIAPLWENELIILETAVRDDKVMQDFELESFLIGGDIP